LLHFSYPQIVVEEVPNEISLALSISGCPLRCFDCHSKETYPNDFGTPLTPIKMQSLIKENKHISCVLFYGGEWQTEYLILLIDIVKSFQLKVCLYTGKELEDIPKDILQRLNYIKVGAYNKELGNLTSKTTNQKFINLDTKEDITNTFQKE